jgi:hypothetical protein
MCCSVSMARVNKNGDRGSHCLRPRICLIHGPFTLFRRTEDEEVESSSKRYSHDTELKAFVISNFMSRAGVLF